MSSPIFFNGVSNSFMKETAVCHIKKHDGFSTVLDSQTELALPPLAALHGVVLVRGDVTILELVERLCNMSSKQTVLAAPSLV